MIPRIGISKESVRKRLPFQRFLAQSAEAIDMTSPAKNIHATRFGTGSLTTTRIAMTIPAISIMIIPIFVPLLKSLISSTPAISDLAIFRQIRIDLSV